MVVTESREGACSDDLPQDHIPQCVSEHDWDLQRGLQLSSAAGWNQLADDWRYMLGRGDNWGVVDTAGNLIASALEVPFEQDLSWISMMLVAEQWRGRGIAAHLLHTCLEKIENTGRACGLDAAERAVSLYERSGFEPVFSILRVEKTATSRVLSNDLAEIERFDEADIKTLSSMDADILGAPRLATLRYLFSRCREIAYQIPGKGGGFCLGRPGAKAFQIGPVNAVNVETAAALVERSLVTFNHPSNRQSVILDVPDYQEEFLTLLRGMGFVATRKFVRMFRAHNPLSIKGPSDQLFAIAGPDLA